MYAGGGTPYQKAAGFCDTPENMFNYLQQEVAGAVDDDTLRRFCDESAQRLSWLERYGAKFASTLCDYKTSYPTDRHYLYFSGNERAHPYCLQAAPAPRGHRQVAKGMSSGRALWTALSQAALGLGVTFMPLTQVTEIVMGAGQVAGVRCRSAAADESWVLRHYRRTALLRAKFTNWIPAIGRKIPTGESRLWQRSREFTVRTPNVILAAGGFAFNRAMLSRHAPEYSGTTPLGTTGDDGNGILLGVNAGGSTDCMHRVTAWRFLSPPAAMLEGVTVGCSGERIASEDLYGATHAEIMVRRFGGRGFLIVDSAIWKRARSQLLKQTQLFQRVQLGFVMGKEFQKGATLEALADKLGISPIGLADTVSAYNDAIYRGVEDPVHKSADLRAPLDKGPFYGLDISIRPSLAYFVPGMTLGGLRVDGVSGAVLTDAGAAIHGLYAAGRSAVGICSNSYVSGLALADCVFSGKRAGEHAARHGSFTTEVVGS